ncbi:hypothetical protein ACMYR3_16990 (plasmid) [Ampullimonas aquatilis]|uniref:hypothetical protein n=1 Tax=Ampullimonas aquatilis TaxID=1341549 RepID=UPI003C757BE9
MQQNFTSELALLMKFTGDTATAIRMYSAYTGGSPSNSTHIPYDREREALDLMFLADALHHFSTLGHALQEANPARLVQTCDRLLRSFSHYDTEYPGLGRRQPKPTFERWRQTIDLNMARKAIAGIRDKALVLPRN